MNPSAFIAIALGVILVVIGIKGTQHNITGVITGHATGAPASGSSGSKGSKSSGSGVILA